MSNLAEVCARAYQEKAKTDAEREYMGIMKEACDALYDDDYGRFHQLMRDSYSLAQKEGWTEAKTDELIKQGINVADFWGRFL